MRDERGNDDQPASCEQTLTGRARSGRAAPGFSPAHLHARSGAPPGVNRKAFYPYYSPLRTRGSGVRISKKAQLELGE